MSLALWASPISDDLQDTCQIPLRGQGKARTLKNRSGRGNRSAHVQNLKASVYGDSLQDSKNMDTESNNGPVEFPEGEDQERQGSATAGLGDFVPLPESAGVQRRIDRDNSSQSPSMENINAHIAPHPNKGTQIVNDAPCTVSGFDDLADTRIEDYYARVSPMYHGVNQNDNLSGPSSRESTLAKLDYLIHLLEEQRDERTGHVTEEIILYSFLGVFMIFIVDSFARVGKYVR